MGRLTYRDNNGNWGLKNLPFDQLVMLPASVYGALAKLQDMECLIDEINDPASSSTGRDLTALCELMAMGTSRQNGNVGGMEWYQRRFDRVT